MANNTTAVPLLSAPTTFHPVIDHLLDSITHATRLAHFLNEPTQQRLALVTTFLLTAALILYLLYHWIAKHPSHAPTILITGPMGTGKTVLFYQLLQSQYRPTQTSMKVNEAETKPPYDKQTQQRVFRFIDFPGHPSLGYSLHTYFSRLRGIIFVVTTAAVQTAAASTTASTGSTSTGNASSTVAPLTQTTQLLFNLLSDPLLQKKRTPVLVVLNKYTHSDDEDDDEDDSQSKEDLSRDTLITRLQSSLESRRSLQSSMPDLSGESEAGSRKISVDSSGSFTFRNSILPITVAAANFKTGDIAEIKTWIQKV